jgi:hypothetical protein
LAEVIKAVARVKGEQWEQFRDRHGDWGRDAVLYLGKKVSGCRLGELGEAVGGLNYRSVSSAIARLGRRAERDKFVARSLRQAQAQLQNAET